MIKLPRLCTLLILLSLMACEDRKTNVQNSPQIDTFQPSNGIDQLKAKLLLNPNDFDSLSALGDMYFESAQYFEAIQIYDRALAINPMCADCLNDKGLASFYLGDSDVALQCFNKAIEADPMLVHAWLSKGFVLVSLGRYDEAVAPLNKVKELDATGNLAIEADKFLTIVNEQSTK